MQFKVLVKWIFGKITVLVVGNQLTGENQMFGTRILIGTMAGHVTMCTLNGVFVGFLWQTHIVVMRVGV